jgi:hypothetical protein
MMHLIATAGGIRVPNVKEAMKAGADILVVGRAFPRKQGHQPCGRSVHHGTEQGRDRPVPGYDGLLRYQLIFRLYRIF